MSNTIPPLKILPSTVSRRPQSASNLGSLFSSRLSPRPKTGGSLIDFTGVRKGGAIRGIRNTHHTQVILDRELRKMFPGDANYELREKLLKEVIPTSIASNGKIFRDDLRNKIMRGGMGPAGERFMTRSQMDKLLGAWNMQQR